MLRCWWPQSQIVLPQGELGRGSKCGCGSTHTVCVRCGDANWIGVWSRCLRLFVANSQIVLSFFVIKWERERAREMWRMTASVRLGIYGCLSLSLSVKQLLSLLLSDAFSRLLSLCVLSAQIFTLNFRVNWCHIPAQPASDPIPRRSLSLRHPCVCVCLWWCVKL